ncbi:hypothetical protein BESB_052620 [Besnoitia besnoiti]|uniref:Uncharacterized protein n=1 Tax=Besnoitia besnoiti TaxID=94643 RepID=A0A2A9MH74_BESBE|nr:hypothetical protein BESB_052620 [Besnoitia besnoiti]PFH35611.1 hypothetical protein BESB_052620 [Besnoitia besnoiti]
MSLRRCVEDCLGVSVFCLHALQNGVRLSDPPCQELCRVADNPQSVASLFASLRKCGLNLVPVPADSRSLGIDQKDAEIERQACRELGFVASFVDFAAVSGSATSGADEVGVRIRENPWCEELDPDSCELEPEFETVVFRQGQCKYLQNRTQAIPLADNCGGAANQASTVAHATLFQCLMTRTHSEKARQRLSKASSPELARNVFEFLVLSKVLSFTVVER